MKSFFITAFLFITINVVICDVIIQNDFRLIDKLNFNNINIYSNVNDNNKNDLKYLTNLFKFDTVFSVKIPALLIFSVNPYVYITDIKDKKMVGLNNCYLKVSSLDYGLEFELGKQYINNTRGNIFFPLNYFSNFMKLNNYDLFMDIFDNSYSFTNINATFLNSFDDYAMSVKLNWMPGLSFGSLKDIYFVSSLVNYSDKNTFQLKVDFDCFQGWSFSALGMIIEKESYDFTKGFYSLYGIGNTIKIADNVKFYQEFSIYNGQSHYELQTDSNPYIPKGFASDIVEKTDSKNGRFFMEYMAGLDIMLPGDVSMEFEYFYGEKGLAPDKANEFYDEIEDMKNDDNTKKILPIQGSYLSFHEINRFQKQYIGLQITKLQIADFFDLTNRLIFSPTELAFSYLVSCVFKINNFVSISAMANVVLGMPKTEYGMELYNLVFRVGVTCQLGSEINIKTKKNEKFK